MFPRGASVLGRLATRCGRPAAAAPGVCLANQSSSPRGFSASASTPASASRVSQHVDDFLRAPPGEFRIISGIQPTGGLHLGNYLGAIRQWAQLQAAMDDPSAPASASNASGNACSNLNARKHILYSIVDLHALTVPGSREDLDRNCFELATALLGSGVDPDKATLFYQSHVPEIAQLQWLLLCSTPMGWLNRMTQFKQKKEQVEELYGKNSVGTGLFTYPVLMAADILLWNATHVPVGDDQTQHLELCRDLADSFNHHYKSPGCFRLPQTIHATAARVMSLADGTAKMSKSAPLERSRIHLTDSDDQIRKKINKAKTDALGAITYEPETRPDIANLIRIHAAMTDSSVEQSAAEFTGKNAVELKRGVADAVISGIAPVRGEILRLRQDPAYVNQVMRQGGERARELARVEWRRICDVVGMPQV